MRVASFALGLAFIALSASACRSPDSDPEAAAMRASAAIKDGVDDTTDTAVVGILHLPSGSLCSGSLIAPNVVLTARHCVAPIIGNPSAIQCASTQFGAVFEPAGFFVTTATPLTIGNAGEYLVAEVLVPVEDPMFCGNDVAILVLDENVDPVAAVPLLPRIDDALAIGETYSIIGYGDDGSGDGAGPRRRRDGLVISCVGSGCIGGEVSDSEWSGNGGVCSGDSGGPAVDEMGRVFGVTSRGDVDCELSVHSSTVAWADWLKDVVVYASGMGLYQAPSWTAGSQVDPRYSMPMGEDCSVAEDCPTGLCINDRDRNVCSRPCDDERPCPEDYICEARGSQSVCVTPEPPPRNYVRPDKPGCSLGVGRDHADAPWVFLAAAALWWTRRRGMA